MNRTLAAVLLLTAATMAQRAHAGVEPDVIYGDDDRLDLYQVQNRKLLELADSTVGLFEAWNVRDDGDKAVFFTRHYGESLNLCKEEPFWEQQAGAFCSGSLVAPDVIMTAGHCVRTDMDCASTKFVFGFAITKKGEPPLTTPFGEVYKCDHIIGREQMNKGADWALIKLDRPVTNHAVLKLDLSGTLANGDPLFIIGHPAGLPTKIAGGAKVRDISPPGFFVATLDAYGGNSGSAVFNAKNGLVEGILVRGDIDYTFKGDCQVSKVRAEDAGRGEDVTKISSVGFPLCEYAAGRKTDSLNEQLPKFLDDQAAALSP
ncbi:MAG: serine protease [Elusimicrobiota bacterium]